MSNDTLGSFLTQIRNASLVKNSSALIPNTKINYQISKILQREGFIKSFQIISNQHLVLYFKYKGKQRNPVLTNLCRVSRPGRRVYANNKEIPTILGGLGLVILSTSKGVLTDREAKFYGVGGEILCSIW